MVRMLAFRKLMGPLFNTVSQLKSKSSAPRKLKKKQKRTDVALIIVNRRREKLRQRLLPDMLARETKDYSIEKRNTISL